MHYIPAAHVLATCQPKKITETGSMKSESDGVLSEKKLQNLYTALSLRISLLYQGLKSQKLLTSFQNKVLHNETPIQEDNIVLFSIRRFQTVFFSSKFNEFVQFIIFSVYHPSIM